MKKVLLLLDRRGKILVEKELTPKNIVEIRGGEVWNQEWKKWMKFDYIQILLKEKGDKE